MAPNSAHSVRNPFRRPRERGYVKRPSVPGHPWDRAHLAWPAAVAALSFPIHLALAVGTELSPDEAYYLASGRFGAIPDHPALCGLLASALWSVRCLPVELRVRLPAMLLSAVCTVVLSGIASEEAERARANGGSRIDPRRAALLASLFANLLPLLAAGGFLLTPDAPAALGFLAALAWSSAAAPSIFRTSLCSTAFVLGALGKVSVVPAALVAWGVRIARARTARDLVRQTLPLLPFAALWFALAASQRFQLLHAFGAAATHAIAPTERLVAWFASMGGFLLVIGPQVVWVGLRAVHRLSPGHRWTFATFTSALIASALVRGVPTEPNWWLPAGLPLVIAASIVVSIWTRRARYMALAVAALPTALAAAQAVHPIVHLPTPRDPWARLHGWREGPGPTEAPGVGPYGPGAEACAYRDECDEIITYIKSLQVKAKP